MPLTKPPINMIGDTSLWGGAYKGMQSDSGAIAASTTALIGAHNCYYDGSNWKYIANGLASALVLSNGELTVYTAPNNTSGANASATLSATAKIDANGNVLGINGVGYGSGSGGSVTQTTNKGTGVTLNKPSGQIVTSNAALGANTTVSFLLTNSNIASSDCVVANVIGAASGLQNYQVWASTASGGAYILLRNISGGSLSEAVTINFAIVKGATS